MIACVISRALPGLYLYLVGRSKKVTTMPNLKAPGQEGIRGFSLKRFSNLHEKHWAILERLCR